MYDYVFVDAQSEDELNALPVATIIADIDDNGVDEDGRRRAPGVFVKMSALIQLWSPSGSRDEIYSTRDLVDATRAGGVKRFAILYKREV